MQSHVHTSVPVENQETEKLSLFAKIDFGFYQLANVSDFMITTWLMYYYTTFLGMSIVLQHFTAFH